VEPKGTLGPGTAAEKTASGVSWNRFRGKVLNPIEAYLSVGECVPHRNRGAGNEARPHAYATETFQRVAHSVYDVAQGTAYFKWHAKEL